MNYQKIYNYRFQNVNVNKKEIVWKHVSKFIYKKLGCPKVMLDPAAGFCEFINNIESDERWAIDLNEDFLSKHADKNVKKIIGSNVEVELQDNYFDGVFISNFLEHLDSQEAVSVLLTKLYDKLKKGGRIAIMGPNFKYASKQYFDFADHNVILTELSLAEHLYGAGFEIKEVHSKFLPLSFRSHGSLPIKSFMIELYLKLPFTWRIMGKQFLLIAEK